MNSKITKTIQMITFNAKQLLQRWWVETKGMAAVEFSLIGPPMLMLMLGVIDMGYGIMSAQKTIRASQVTADLIARHKSVNQNEIDEAVKAGMLAISPFDTTSYGYDIISIQFDKNKNPKMSPPLWRETSPNIAANDDFVDSIKGLMEEGDGMVVVQIYYKYKPFFAGFAVGEIELFEKAFVQGRLSRTVPKES